MLKSMVFRGNVRKDIRQKYGAGGGLLDIYAGIDADPVHKWHHYIGIYERYFARFRGKPVHFLEIGVARGGSLTMWRRYFGTEAVICGIDVDPDCARLDGRDGMVRIGSQADAAFMRNVVEEMGGIDVVLDDGSHRMDHIRKTLRALYPALNLGGVYMIEDLHTAYFEPYGGGSNERANFFNEVRDIVDDMHHWYHPMPSKVPELKDQVSAIHVHDSIIVLEKNRVYPPVHSRVGQP